MILIILLLFCQEPTNYQHQLLNNKDEVVGTLSYNTLRNELHIKLDTTAWETLNIKYFHKGHNGTVIFAENEKARGVITINKMNLVKMEFYLKKIKTRLKLEYRTLSHQWWVIED